MGFFSKLSIQFAGLAATSALVATTAFAGATPTTAATSPAATPAQAEGKVPALYADPASRVAGKTLIFSTQVTKKPSKNANVYWAHQFNVNNAGNANVGYIGFQTRENSSGQNLMIFAVWGATDCEATGTPGSHCLGNTDGETGQSVRIWKKWNAGTEYRLAVSPIPNRTGWWSGAIVEPSTGAYTPIGNLKFGNSSSTLTPVSSWVEYWNWSDLDSRCTDQENSAATYRPFTVDGRTVPYGNTKTGPSCVSTSSHRVNSDGSATLTASPYGR